MKCAYLIIALLFFTHNSIAQDTLYFDDEYKEIQYSPEATEYKVILLDSLVEDRATVKWFYINGAPKKSIEYYPYSKEVLDGETRHYYDNGKLEEIITYKGGKMNGIVKTYFQNGQMRREDYFEDHEFVQGTCWDSTGVKTEHTAYLIYPEFPGGEDALFEFLGTNVKYPNDAKLWGKQGIVYAQFVVSETGVIEEHRIFKGVSESLDREALRVIASMPNWKPGLKEGKPVKFTYNLPIRFALEGPSLKRGKRKNSISN